MNLGLPLMPSLSASMHFLDALNCANLSGRPPVWIMRQAGRYLPEYQALRKKHTIEQLFRDPELIAEVTLQPLRRFPLDASIVFADILHVLLPLGHDVTFPPGGPQVATKNTGKRSVQEALGFVKEGIHLLKKELTVPLIGFCGGPFTVAYYLLQKKPERLMNQDPEAFHQILNDLTDISIEYLQMQIEAGVDAIQLFESWANMLSQRELKTYVLPYLKRLIDAVDVPVIVFGRGTCLYPKEFVSLAPAAISFDASYPIAEMRKHVPATIAVQGNLPPGLLYAPPETIRKETKAHLDSMKGDPGFIVNLGHGIYPDIPVEHVQAFIETVKTA